MNRAMMMIKVVILCSGLVLVVLLMSKLGSNGLPSGFLSIFGLPTSGDQGAGGGRVATLLSPLHWCETRVQELELPGSIIVRQTGSNWLSIVGGQARSMDNLQVEKWFGQHCTVAIEKVAIPDKLAFERYMTVKFIKGEPREFLRSADGLLKWKNEVFRSSELEAALQSLAAQAQPAPGG